MVKILISASQLVNQVFFNNYKWTENLRPFKYILKVEVENGILIYHQLNGTLVFVEGTKLQDWESLSLDKTDIDTLIKLRILVGNEFDDDEILKKYVEFKSVFIGGKIGKKVMVYTTTSCNARCWYCAQKGKFIGESMSDESAKKAVQTILNNISGNFNLVWYGGEPLVNKKAISIITEELKKKNVRFKSTIITNGLLLDKNTILSGINNWNLNTVQVTIDGTQENYNRIKNYKGNIENAYEIIIYNIQNLIDNGIRVLINLNLSQENGLDLIRLMDELNKLFPDKKNLRISIEPLYQIEFADSLSDDVKSFYTELIKKIYRDGWSSTDDGLRVSKLGYCAMEWHNGFNIKTNGKIFGCQRVKDVEYEIPPQKEEVDKAIEILKRKKSI